MNKAWRLVGLIAFWLSWPVLYVYLRGSKRTRVLIRHEGELLVEKGWLGHGRWILPGGGLHKGEDPAEGAVREVYEETGVKLKPGNLTFLFKQQIQTRQHLRFQCYVYAIELDNKPPLTVDKKELVTADWRPVNELQAEGALEPILTPALEAWERLD